MPDCADRRLWKLIDRERIDDVLTRYRRALDRREAGTTPPGFRYLGPCDE